MDFRQKNHIRVQKHRAEKPEMNRAITMRRYVRKWNQTHLGHDKAAELALFREATRLTKQTGIVHQVDHIIPIAAGGWHHHENMQVLPVRVNTSKNDNQFWIAPDGSGFKDWRDVPEWLWPEPLRFQYLRRMNRQPECLLTG